MPRGAAKVLTDLAVEKLAPLEPGKRREVGDARTPGLILRVSSARNKTWNLVYRVIEQGEAGGRKEWVRGSLKRMSLGQWPVVSLELAREKARDAMKLADKGIDPADARDDAAAKRKAGAFEVVFERFVELHVKQNTKEGRFARDRAAAMERAKADGVEPLRGPNGKLGRVAAERLVADNALPVWRGRMIETITRAEVHELLDDVTVERGMPVARELRKHLSALFNWAADRGHIAISPLAGMRRKGLQYKPRERFLSMEELQRVWDAAGALGYPFGPMYRLLILTGQRRSEVAEIERGDNDLPSRPRSEPTEEEGRIKLEEELRAVEIPASRHKSKKYVHVYPLSEPAWALVESLPRWNGGDCVFSTTGGKRPISGFSKAKELLDVKIAELGRKSGEPPMAEWTVHDIRRSVATHLARLGFLQEHIERVLGHVVQGVAGTYNRYSYLDEKRKALEAWGKLWKA